MNFLGVGGLEIIVIALVGFLVLGPKRLTQGARTAAKALNELRRQRDDLTGMVADAVDLESLDGLDETPPSSSVARPGGDRRTPPATDETADAARERKP